MPDNELLTSKNLTAKIILAFAAIYTIWGTTYLALRIAVETLPPFLMSGVRFLIAGGLLFLFLRLRGAPMPVRLHWRSAVIIGFFLMVGGNGLVTWSEQQVPSSTAALVVATMPMWIALFDWLIFKKPRPGRRVAVGLVLGLIGILLLVGPGQVLGTARFSLGALFILLLAPVLWSFGSLYSRGADLPHDTFMATAIEMLAGGALLLVIGLLTGEANRLNIAQFSTRSLAAFAYLTLFGSIIAFTAYIWLLKVVPATKVVTYTYVNPVIAVFLGWLILSEPVTGTMIVSVVVIILAVVLITTARQTSRPAGKRTGEPVISEPAGQPALQPAYEPAVQRPTSHAAFPSRAAAEATESDSDQLRGPFSGALRSADETVDLQQRRP
jgi:drug/metabolite transporter (DMT)-like permease